MKKFKIYSTVFAAFLLISVACKKDKEAPTITIKGDNPASVIKGTTYSDDGATAVDGEGNSVTVTTDDSDVNTDLAGSYKVEYAASNDNGTTTAKRKVNVTFNSSSYVQAWTVDSDCSGTEFPMNTSQNPTLNTSTGQLEFPDFLSIGGGTALATVSGTTITFPSQDMTVSLLGQSGIMTIDGSGTMNNSGTEMVITFNYDSSTIPFVGTTGTCTATFSL